MNIIERIRARVNVNELTGCWEWHGSTSRGYGSINVGGNYFRTHRLMFFAHNPGVSCDLHVLHRCDNKLCNNPDHLFAGTNRENMLDKVTKGRANSPKGEQNGRSKLTEVEVSEILGMLSRGITGAEIARRFEVTRQVIYRIKSGKIWSVVRR